MIKKSTFLKSLLMGALLIGGVSQSWADTFTGTIGFNALSRITKNDNGTFTTAVNAGKGYALALADLSALDNIASATSVTLEFDVTVGGRLIIGIGDKNVRGTNANGSSKSTYNTDGLVMRYGTTDGTYVRVNGGTNNSNLLNASSHVKFTLDRVAGKYSYTITYQNGDNETVTGFTASDVATSVAHATVVEAYSWNNDQTFALSDVKYSYEYTPASYDYTVNAVDAENHVLKELAAGTTMDAVTVYYPYAVKKDDVWYVTSTSNYSAQVNQLQPTVNITYTADPTIAFFGEVEDIYSGGKSANKVTDNAAFSNGGGYYAQSSSSGFVSIAFSVPADGVYDLRLAMNNTNNRDRGFNYAIDDDEVSGTITVTTGTAYVHNILQSLTAGEHTLTLNITYSLTPVFDYLLIKTVSPVSVTIGSAGYATFASTAALDLSKLPKGLTAYKADGVADGKVNFTAVTEAVPAGTGLLLKGTAGESYEIPVAATAAALADNQLVGVTAETTLEEGKAYVLKGDKFIRAAAGKLAAGKAYLPVSSGAPELTISFGAETTGISVAKAESVKGAEVYNLAGQRVSQPTKGLYIVGGKKVVLK